MTSRCSYSLLAVSVRGEFEKNSRDFFFCICLRSSISISRPSILIYGESKELCIYLYKASVSFKDTMFILTISSSVAFAQFTVKLMSVESHQPFRRDIHDSKWIRSALAYEAHC